jgi:acyl-coenzyme A synthetase/AMP-(fatty) acid ligase/pimeloyl-ACP methyl ester carboxylesterase
VIPAAPTAAQLAAFGLEPSWSRVVDVPSHDGATHRWHLLDRPGTDPRAVTVLCLHGNPTWSFLWSRLLHELAPQHRVIAPDQLSMGYSERLADRRYRDRVADVADLLSTLDVGGPVWLVAQDWGGAVAMGFAVAHPEQVAGMVLSNTGIAVPEGRHAPWLIRLAAANGVHRLATRTTSTFVRGTPWLPGGRLTRVQRRALAAPYSSPELRDAVAGFVADVPFADTHPSAADLAAVAEALPSLSIPVRLVWGSRDPVFDDSFAEDLVGRFHDVELHRIAAAGHLCVLETSLAPYVEAALREHEFLESRELPFAHGVECDSVWGRILGSAESTGIAISDAAADDSITHHDFAQRVSQFAQALDRHHVRPGDRVAVLVPPGIDLITVVYACWRIGAVTVVADRGLGLRGLGAAVRSARVRHVVGPGRALAAARVLRWAPAARRIDIASLTSAAPSLDRLELPSPALDDPAAVVFTSGATGPAKGVRYSHRQLCAQRDALRALYGITDDDRFVAAFAPFAVFGPALGIATGLADMDVTKPATLTAATLDDACRRLDATMVFASPAALANVVRTADGPLPALAKVRLVMSAGAPVPIDTLRGIAALCPHAELHTPYGMTEVLPVADISLTARVAVGAGRGVCVGRCVSGCDVMIVDPDATQPLSPLLVGVTGEVVVTSPWMSSGYDRLWHTQQLARPQLAGRTWHRTGDVGHLDMLGNLWIEGRVVHLVDTPEGPVSPVPIEVAAESVAGVRRAAAVGVGPRGVQQVVVVVETDGGDRDGPASAELASAVRAAVAPQHLAAVWVGAALPVDIRHNAKIDRAALGRTMERRLSGKAR